MIALGYSDNFFSCSDLLSSPALVGKVLGFFTTCRFPLCFLVSTFSLIFGEELLDRGSEVVSSELGIAVMI